MFQYAFLSCGMSFRNVSILAEYELIDSSIKLNCIKYSRTDSTWLHTVTHDLYIYVCCFAVGNALIR